MVTTGQVVVTCPICKKNSFTTTTKGMLFKTYVYKCTACNSVLETQKGETFKIVEVGEDYSNVRPYIVGKQLKHDALANEAAVSDADLDSYAAGDSNLFEDLLEEARNKKNANFPIILKKDEVPLISIPDLELNEERSQRVSSGTRASVRLMKGVYVSQALSQPEYKSVLKGLDTGTLIFTNQRYIFAGKSRSIDQPLTKITSLTIYKDGISVARSNRQKTEFFIGEMYWPLVGAIIKGLVARV